LALFERQPAGSKRKANDQWPNSAFDPAMPHQRKIKLQICSLIAPSPELFDKSDTPLPPIEGG
jgi:hypothetical protein